MPKTTVMRKTVFKSDLKVIYVLHPEKSNLKARGLLSNWRRTFLLEMVIKVLLSFLRLFPLGRQIESLQMRVFLSKREYFYFRVGPNVWCGTNTNKFCTATGGPVLVSGDHATCGLVAAAARGLLAAHGWVGGPRGRFYQLLTHCFLTLHHVSLLNQVSAKVYSCAWCWRFERVLTQGDLVKVFHFSLFSLHHWCKAPRQKGRRWHP